MRQKKSYRIHSAVILFSLFEFIYWSGNGLFYSFYVPFMTEKGLSNSHIGLVLSLNALLLLITLPIWGILTDRLKSPKLVLTLMFIFSSLIMIFIPSLRSNRAIAACICLTAVFESGIATMLDSYLVQAVSLIPGATYGSIRLCGSVGIVSSLILSANMVKSFGTGAVFYYYSISLILLLPVLALLPSLTQNSVKEKLRAKELFLNFRYISFLLFVTLLFIPYRFSVSFLIQAIQHVKGSTGNLSYSLLFSYASEITFYFLSIYLFRRYKLINIIYASGIFFIIRQLGFSLVQQPYQVYLAQLTQGPTFTLMSAAALLYINELAPDNLKSTAQAVGNGFLFGVSGIASNALGGYLIDTVGIVKTFYAGVFLTSATMIAYALINYISKIQYRRSQLRSSQT